MIFCSSSFCYKFYWLEAVVHIISEGKNETTFDEIIDEMIANAWYSVREFHIHLSGIQADGLVRDGLERAILQLTELSDLPANASKIEIKNSIREHQAGLKKAKEQLTNMVPEPSAGKCNQIESNRSIYILFHDYTSASTITSSLFIPLNSM